MGIYIRDETTDRLRIVIARNKNIRKINDAQLLKKIIKILSTSKKYTLNWVNEDAKVKVVGFVKTIIMAV